MLLQNVIILTFLVLTQHICFQGANSVAWELFQIFMTQGCPLILQHDNGREFVNQVISRHSNFYLLKHYYTNLLLFIYKVVGRIKRLWPGCVIVRGRPRHPQTQSSIERANKDVEEMLGTITIFAK